MSKLSYVTTVELERLRSENETSAKERAEAEAELAELRKRAMHPLVAAARTRVLVTVGSLITSEDAGDADAFARYMTSLRRELMDLEVAEVTARSTPTKTKAADADSDDRAPRIRESSSECAPSGGRAVERPDEHVDQNAGGQEPCS